MTTECQLVVLLDLAQSYGSVRRRAGSSESRRCPGSPGSWWETWGACEWWVPSGALALPHHGSQAAVTCPQTTGLAGASGRWAWDRHRGASGEDTCLPLPASPVTHTPGLRGLRAVGLQTTLWGGCFPSQLPPRREPSRVCRYPEMTFLAKWHLIVRMV